MSKKNIGIYGMGASGTLLFALLANNSNAQNNIFGFDNDEKALAPYRSDASEISVKFSANQEDNFSTSLPHNNLINTSKINSETPRQDVVFVTVTANQSEKEWKELADKIYEVTDRNSVIVYIPNGNEGLKSDLGDNSIPIEFAKYLPNNGTDRTIVRGVLEHPATKNIQTGEITSSSLEKISQNGISIGSDSGLTIPQKNTLAKVCKDMGIGFKQDKPQNKMLFDKFLQIITMGYQAAIPRDAGNTFGEVVKEGSRANQLFNALFEEAWQVAVKAGIHENTDEAKENLRQETLTAYEGKKAAIGSLAQAVNSGKKTEAREIYGSFIDFAKKYNISTPNIEGVFRLALATEKYAKKTSQPKSGGTWLESFRRRVENAINSGISHDLPKKVISAISSIFPANTTNKELA